jgi:acetyl-CoA C-acetyltransferase
VPPRFGPLAGREFIVTDAYIVGAVRTPVTRRGGALANIHPADLGAHVLLALIERTGIDPSQVDDVMLGCLDAMGPQAGDIARTSWLAAGLPDHVPGVTVDRQCGSSQQAVHFAAQAVMSETADLVVAGGVQNMSQVPLQASWRAGEAFGLGSDPFLGSVGWQKRYGDVEVSQFEGVERVVAKWALSREEMEEFALTSHRRAIAAQDAGFFEEEIAPFDGVFADDGPRRDTSLAKMAALSPLRPNGKVTAAMASQISDGAAMLLIASERAVEEYGLTKRARIHHLSARGADPIEMLTAPIDATRVALERTGLTLDDIDRVEINEAFGPVVLAWQRECGADLAKVNVDGGAIALGHPLGATGARLMTSMLHALERTGGRYGLQTMCEAGGQANVTIIERLG